MCFGGVCGLSGPLKECASITELGLKYSQHHIKEVEDVSEV
jgi:hypothetical protein